LKLEKMRKEAGFSSPVVSSTTYRGRGARGALRGGRSRSTWVAGGARGGSSLGRGRGTLMNSSSILDNRPKAIIVSGFEADEKDEVTKLFLTFGEVDRIEEKDSNQVIFTYRARHEAELAAAHGGTFKQKTLSLAWYRGEAKTNATAATTTAPAAVTANTAMGVDVLAAVSAAESDTRSADRSVSMSSDDDNSKLLKDDDDEMLDIDKDEEDMLLAGAEDEEDEDTDRPWRR